MIEKITNKHGPSYRARITWIDGKPMTQTFRRKTPGNERNSKSAIKCGSRES